MNHSTQWDIVIARAAIGRLTLGSCLVLASGCDSAVSVRGRVTDLQTGAPIEDAALTVYGSGMPKTGHQATSDAQGSFEIHVVTGPWPRVDSLMVASRNYATVVVRPTQRELPTLEVQLAGPLASGPSRVLGELPQRSTR
jgi:hypothetical protein